MGAPHHCAEASPTPAPPAAACGMGWSPRSQQRCPQVPQPQWETGRAGGSLQHPGVPLRAAGVTGWSPGDLGAGVPRDARGLGVQTPSPAPLPARLAWLRSPWASGMPWGKESGAGEGVRGGLGAEGGSPGPPSSSSAPHTPQHPVGLLGQAGAGPPGGKQPLPGVRLLQTPSLGWPGPQPRVLSGCGVWGYLGHPSAWAQPGQLLPATPGLEGVARPVPTAGLDPEPQAGIAEGCQGWASPLAPVGSCWAPQPPGTQLGPAAGGWPEPGGSRLRAGPAGGGPGGVCDAQQRHG